MNAMAPKASVTASTALWILMIFIAGSPWIAIRPFANLSDAVLRRPYTEPVLIAFNKPFGVVCKFRSGPGPIRIG